MGQSDPKHVQQTRQVKDDTEIFEVIIFTLSPVLGGRDQVLATPFIECVKYVEMENKRKVNDRWNAFLDRIYSDSQAGVDKLKREKYMEMIQPKETRKSLEMKTDVDQLKRMKEEQDRKRAKQSEQGG